MPLLVVHGETTERHRCDAPNKMMISASGEDTIARVIHVQQDLSDNDFEIQRTVDEIIKGNYKRVKSSKNHPRVNIFIW
jgi:hypothetical protein